MDGHRFDRLSKSLVTASSRRRFVGRAGGGGLAALLGAGFARADAAPRSQVSTPVPPAEGEPLVCGFAFEATVRQGPSGGTTYRGGLKLAVDPTGGVTGWLGVPDPNVATPASVEDVEWVAVAGQARGRAINLLFQVSEDHYVYGVGTLEQPITACEGRLGGPFVGPQPGDAGDWVGSGGRCSIDCIDEYNACFAGLSEEEQISTLNVCDLVLNSCLSVCAIQELSAS